MSGFKAAEAVAALDYDFGEYGPSGTVPEPSREQLDAFWDGRRKILEDAGIDLSMLESLDPLDPESRVELTKAFASIPEEKRKAMAPAQIENVAKLCAGSPSEEELKLLPGRYQDAFFGWLMGMLSNPTSPNGTND
jgi:hypothetical protein